LIELGIALVQPTLNELPSQLLEPIFRHRVGNLAVDQFQLNCGIIKYEGKTLLAYRKGWGNAEVWLAELDDNFDAISNVKLEVPATKYNELGSEDPRLFIHEGKLFLMFIGYTQATGKRATHILYSLISSNGAVVSTFLPYLSARGAWEKNWGFFSYRKELYAVYSIHPHIIIKVSDDRAWISTITSLVYPDYLGSPRSGSSPFLHNDEWYCFTHNCFRYGNNRWYGMCCYTFENKPPFKPLRYADGFLMLPDKKDRPASHVPHVIFPNGAYLENNEWIVSYGYYDKYSEVVKFDAMQLEGVLKPI